MDETLLKKIADAAATWKQIGEGIESKPLVTFAEHTDALLRQHEANRERLAKAMEREAALKDECKRLADEHKKLADANKALAETISRYDCHPEVREAKRNAIAEQLRRLQAQAETLKDPEPKPE